MSRNRGSLVCACDLWDFMHAPNLPANELITAEQYRAIVGSRYLLDKVQREMLRPGEAPMLYRKASCPVCGRTYALWYRQVRHDPASGYYILDDTSYWSSYNDEPGPDDGPTLTITPEALVAAYRQQLPSRAGRVVELLLRRIDELEGR